MSLTENDRNLDPAEIFVSGYKYIGVASKGIGISKEG